MKIMSQLVSRIGGDEDNEGHLVSRIIMRRVRIKQVSTVSTALKHILLNENHYYLFVSGAFRKRSSGNSVKDRNLHGLGMSHATTTSPLHNHSLGHLGGWVTPRSAEEMLDGQH